MALPGARAEIAFHLQREAKKVRTMQSEEGKVEEERKKK